MIRVFLDTSVVLDILREGASSGLLDTDLLDRVRYVVNPVVLQEVLLAGASAGPLEQVLDRAIEVRPLDVALSGAGHRERLKRLRSAAGHGHHLLMLSSADAAGCDYLVTLDHDLLRSAGGESFRTVTPSAFLGAVGAAA